MAAFRDRIREEYREVHPKCRKRDAHEYAWSAALAEFPPPGVDPSEAAEEPADPKRRKMRLAIPLEGVSVGVSGLGDVPADWPERPANASLAAEIQWVQATRLSVVRK